MRFYLDIIKEQDPAGSPEYHYFQWDEDSIRQFWYLCNRNPILKSQFYPKSYWLDLLSWYSEKHSAPVAQAADVGCGSGTMLECLLETLKPGRVYGVDLAEEALSYVRTRFQAHPEVEIRQGGFAQLPFADGTLDLVVSTEVLEHLFPADFSQAFTEVSRVLRPGGHWLATVPFGEDLRMVICPNCHHLFAPYQHMLFELSQRELEKEMAQNGLKLADRYRGINREEPKSVMKKWAKTAIIKIMPSLAAKLFPLAGTTGFLAVKQSR